MTGAELCQPVGCLTEGSLAGVGAVVIHFEVDKVSVLILGKWQR